MRERLVYLTVLGLVAFFPSTPSAQGVDADGDPVRGQQLFRQLGCLECHTVRGEGGGGETEAPELSTVFGETIDLADGEKVEANEAYLLESIVEPEAKTVKDYPKGKMPTRFANLPETDLAALVSYIKVLADKELAARVLPATSIDVPVEIGPVATAVGMWIVLGLSAFGLASVSIVSIARRLTWRWVGLIAAFPALGVAAGVGWANYSASSGNSYREVEVTARQFAYDPPVIRVNRGDHVTVTLRSKDTLHGFYLDGYGIDQEVRPGETIRFTFVADKSGKFGFRCSHTCGVLHPFMMGNLIVAPNNLFAGSLGLVFGLGLAAFAYVAKKTE